MLHPVLVYVHGLEVGDEEFREIINVQSKMLTEDGDVVAPRSFHLHEKLSLASPTNNTGTCNMLTVVHLHYTYGYPEQAQFCPTSTRLLTCYCSSSKNLD